MLRKEREEEKKKGKRWTLYIFRLVDGDQFTYGETCNFIYAANNQIGAFLPSRVPRKNGQRIGFLTTILLDLIDMYT